GHLWEPEVHASESGEYNGTEDGVVEVSDKEVRLSQVEVQCRSCQHNAGHTTEEEGAHKAHGPNHWGIPGDVALPHGAYPVEELHTGWNRNKEGHEREERKQNCTGYEHVVCPYSHGQCTNGKKCEDHAGVAEDWLTGEHWNHFGIISEVVPVFSRKPVFGYTGMVFALLAIGALSMAVWAHHMFVTGAVLLPFFSFMTFLIAVPTGMKFFNWVGTMWKGHITWDTPMIWAMGFMGTFLFGGMTGVMLAAPALDFQLAESYFLIAHFHYTVFGTVVFSAFAGLYFWFPKMTGRMLDERLGKIHFWLTFIGFHGTFLIQHWVGNIGMPRRYADYLESDGFTIFNQISTVFSFILGASVIPLVWNVFKSYRYGEIVTVDDPWGYGNSLEWATSCPPPRHIFESLPSIRSERPAFELHYPHMVKRLREEAHAGSGH